MDLNWFQKIDSLNDLEVAKTDLQALKCTLYLFEDQDPISEKAREDLTEDAFIALHRIERILDKYCAMQSTKLEYRNWAEDDLQTLKSILKNFEKNDVLSADDRETFTDEALVAIHRFERAVHKYFKKQKLEKNICSQRSTDLPSML